MDYYKEMFSDVQSQHITTDHCDTYKNEFETSLPHEFGINIDEKSENSTDHCDINNN